MAAPPEPPKTPTHVSSRAELVRRAADATSWLEENREAVEAYNAHVAKHGVFSDGRRRF